MISKVDFSSNAALVENYYHNDLPITSLAKIANINFFVGPNNSGKSRFLRDLSKLFARYVSPKLEDNSILQRGNSNSILITHLESERVSELLGNVLEKTKIISQDLHDEWIKEFRQGNVLNEKHLATIYNRFSFLTHPKAKHLERFNDEAIKQLSDLKKILRTAINDLFEIPSENIFQVTYLPSFRSLRKFEKYTKDNFPRVAMNVDYSNFEEIQEPILATRSYRDHFTQTVKDLGSFSGPEKKIISTMRFEDIFSGEMLFDQIRELRNGTEDKRDILVGFEEFLSAKFFNGERIHLNSIEADGIKEVYVKIGQEKEFPIFNLGDGIQAIILLIFPLFYNRKYRHVIFYEEPELYLHPGMQRIFIDALRTFEHTTSFLVTHSNHILDTSFDYKDEISIFCFEKKLQKNKAIFNISPLSSPDLSLLNLLGVRNSSIFLSNCCIWVEGVSDRIYINKYLSLYMKTECKGEAIFHEDLHFSFLEFGGNQIVHYDFADNVDTVDAKKSMRSRLQIG